jgi:hypothetical protein
MVSQILTGHRPLHRLYADTFAYSNSKLDTATYAVSDNNINPNPTLVADETGKFEECYFGAMNVGQNVLEIALPFIPRH